MQSASLVMKFLSRLSSSLLSSAQAAEVLSGLGANISTKLTHYTRRVINYLKHNASHVSIVRREVHEHHGILSTSSEGAENRSAHSNGRSGKFGKRQHIE